MRQEGESRKLISTSRVEEPDLIDGEDLVDMLKQLRLGVEVRMVEEVDVNTAWFENI